MKARDFYMHAKDCDCAICDYSRLLPNHDDVDRAGASSLQVQWWEEAAMFVGREVIDQMAPKSGEAYIGSEYFIG